MLPIPALPHPALAFAVAAGVYGFGFGDVSAKILFDEHDALRIIIVAVGQGHDEVHVFGQNDNGGDFKWVAGLYGFERLAQDVDVLGQ